MFISSQNGHVRVVQYLISCGANVDQQRMDGTTPLWISSQMNHILVVKTLLNTNASVDKIRRVSAKQY